MSSPDELRAFDESAAALATRIADAESRGEPVPVEAYAMLASLRQLTRAVADLQASLDAPSADAATEPPATDRPA